MFTLQTEGEKKPYPVKFKQWRDAFDTGKKIGKPFYVTMDKFVIAAWNKKEGFYSYTSPELILQTQEYERKRSTSTVKPLQSGAH